jgi:hypothetical protein
MTAQEVKTYLEETYGECRHDEYAMAEAINKTCKELEEKREGKYTTEWDLFHLLVENTPIPSLHTHSYGFHTANGRGIIERMQNYYHEYAV